MRKKSAHCPEDVVVALQNKQRRLQEVLKYHRQGAMIEVEMNTSLKDPNFPEGYMHVVPDYDSKEYQHDLKQELSQSDPALSWVLEQARIVKQALQGLKHHAYHWAAKVIRKLRDFYLGLREDAEAALCNDWIRALNIA